MNQVNIEYIILGISVVVSLGLGFGAYMLIRRGLNTLTKKQNISKQVSKLALTITRWIILFVVFLLILQQFGIRVASIWTLLITLAAMIAVGFIAVWSLLSNLLCALLFVILRPFNLEEKIEIIEATGGEGLKGKVIRYNALFTILEEEKENGEKSIVQIPNNVFFQKTIRRWMSD